MSRRTAARAATSVLAIAVAGLLPAGPPAAAAAPGGAAAPGCRAAVDQVGGTSAKHELESGGLVREYVLHLPEGFERRSSWPLVVAFHGRGSTGVEVEGYSRLSTLPAVVAYPAGEVGTGDGHRRAWQGAPYAAPGVDDVAFVADLLDTLQRDACADPRRTYATGKSNGGGLAALLACRLPDRFAAVGLVAAALYPGTREDCADGADSDGVPVITVHGTGDATIPYAGDPDRGLPDVARWTADQAARQDCAPRPRVTRRGRDVAVTRWRGCTQGRAVEHVAVDDGGHVWPGAEVYSGGGHVTRTIRAERVLWRFFTRHALAGAGADRTAVERGTSR